MKFSSVRVFSILFSFIIFSFLFLTYPTKTSAQPAPIACMPNVCATKQGTCDGSDGGRPGSQYCQENCGITSVCNACGIGYYTCSYPAPPPPTPSPSPTPAPTCVQTPGSFASYDGCVSCGYDRYNYYNCNGSTFSITYSNPDCNYLCPVPDCNSGISCSGSCSASYNTCYGGNGTQGSCVYTTYSSGGSCNQVTAPNQICSVNNCSAGYTCTGGTCTPIQSPNPTPTPSCNKVPGSFAYTTCTSCDYSTNNYYNCDGSTYQSGGQNDSGCSGPQFCTTLCGATCTYSENGVCKSGNCLDGSQNCSTNVNCGYVANCSSGTQVSCNNPNPSPSTGPPPSTGPTCGDGTCDPSRGESCRSCSQDCGTCNFNLADWSCNEYVSKDDANWSTSISANGGDRVYFKTQITALKDNPSDIYYRNKFDDAVDGYPNIWQSTDANNGNYPLYFYYYFPPGRCWGWPGACPDSHRDAGWGTGTGVTYVWSDVLNPGTQTFKNTSYAAYSGFVSGFGNGIAPGGGSCWQDPESGGPTCVNFPGGCSRQYGVCSYNISYSCNKVTVNTTVPISGYVKNSQTGAGMPGIQIQLYDSNLNQTQYPVTDSTGHFEVDNFARYGDFYAVRVSGNLANPQTAPTGYTPPAATSEIGWNWNFALNPNVGTNPWADTPLGSSSYEGQKAGSGVDCAGPNGSGVSGRCSFVYNPLPAPTNTVASCNGTGTAVTFSWNAVAGADSYLIRVNDDAGSSPGWVDVNDFTVTVKASYACSGRTCKFTTGPSSYPPNLVINYCTSGSPTCSNLSSGPSNVVSGDPYDFSVQPIAPGESYPYVGTRSSSVSFNCLTWTINAQPVCSNGATPKGQTQIFYKMGLDGDWNYGSLGSGVRTQSITTNEYAVWLGLQSSDGSILNTYGTPPSSAISYGTYFNPPTPMAQWNTSALPSGTYTLQFQAPNSSCILTAPWIQTTGGDVHSNSGINTPGGP